MKKRQYLNKVNVHFGEMEQMYFSLFLQEQLELLRDHINHKKKRQKKGGFIRSLRTQGMTWLQFPGLSFCLTFSDLESESQQPETPLRPHGIQKRPTLSSQRTRTVATQKQITFRQQNNQTLKNNTYIYICTHTHIYIVPFFSRDQNGVCK